MASRVVLEALKGLRAGTDASRDVRHGLGPKGCYVLGGEERERGGPSTKLTHLACARGDGERGFIDLDNRDSLPPQVSEFLPHPGENRGRIGISEERGSNPPSSAPAVHGAPSQEGGNTASDVEAGNTATVNGSIQNPVQVSNPGDETVIATGSPGPHTREAGGLVEEAVTGGGPEGEEMWVQAADWIQQGPVLPPESEGLSNTNGSAPQDCR